MPEAIVTAVIGIACVLLGIFNMRGHISTLHSYHRHRVSEEDRLPFGRLVGLGTVIIGASITVFAAFNAAFAVTQNSIFTVIGSVLMIVGIVVGLGISFYAMKKYNKGIF